VGGLPAAEELKVRIPLLRNVFGAYKILATF